MLRLYSSVSLLTCRKWKLVMRSAKPIRERSELIKLKTSLNRTFFVERMKVLCKHLKHALLASLGKTPLYQHIFRWRHTNYLCHMLGFLQKWNNRNDLIQKREKQNKTNAALAITNRILNSVAQVSRPAGFWQEGSNIEPNQNCVVEELIHCKSSGRHFNGNQVYPTWQWRIQNHSPIPLTKAGCQCFIARSCHNSSGT